MSRSRLMLTARDRAPLPRRRLLPLTVFLAAAVALLAFAGIAAAETKIGEYTGAPNPEIPAEANVLGATTEYDSTAGTMNFTVTTAAEPRAEIEGKENEILLIVGYATLPVCSLSEFETGGGNAGFPVFELETPYSQQLAETITGESQKEVESGPANLGLGAKTVEGTKTTLTAQSPKAVGKAYTCGLIGLENVENKEEEFVEDFAIFPLSTKVTPPPVVTPPAPVQTSQPAPAAAALAIAKVKKPLKLKAGKWATVKVKVTNTGGSTTPPGSLQLKAAKGVIVKGGKQKLPALLPGGSWTVSYKVKLTTKAKKTSTLPLVGTAGTVSSKSSLVLKLAGG
ncbi:MAG: hypothetical protein JWO14_2945 [Solirubrobacterales bacterium]|nr:hypothetical protein [Solirubrobacterales bacterium]